MIRSLMIFWTGLAYANCISNSSKSDDAVQDNEVVPGRYVALPAKDYITGFKVAAPQLGDCALQMQGMTIKTCSEKIKGAEIWIPSASSGVDVSRVRTSEDVVTYGMGGIGANVGVLGLVGIGTKLNIGVRTQTSSKHLSLMTSYELKRGVVTLHNPFPVTSIPDEGTIYLSEIEFGGNEMLLVTMEFQSFYTKVQVEMQLQIKILFITISAKMRFVYENMGTSFKSRIHFKSSWRPLENMDKSLSSVEDAIEEVERLEALYIDGPNEMAKLDTQDEKLHHMYYFSFWKKSPFEKDTNFASISNDLAVLDEQYMEIESVLQTIEDQLENNWIQFQDQDKKKRAETLQRELKVLRSQLVTGMNAFSSLTVEQRIELNDIYGLDKAPGFYRRKWNTISAF